MRKLSHARRVPGVIVLLSVVQIASAFYDPAPQRWVNRDPMGEPGVEPLLAKQDRKIQPQEASLYKFLANNPVSQMDALGLWYDTITAYMRGCTTFPTAQSRCGCYCAPVTTGSSDSKDCIDGCMRCEKLATGAFKGKPDPMSLCLCFCEWENKKAKKNGEKTTDCGKVCGKVVPKKCQDPNENEADFP